MNILTPFQVEFIRQFALSPLRDAFFLTGGTALSEFYLQHRYSEDMDFFTEEEGYMLRSMPAIEEIAATLGGSLEIARNFQTYKEIHLHRGDEDLRCDFALDAPYRLEKIKFDDPCGIYVDNPIDMACNKLSALFDRNHPKDFVDVYFIAKEILPFERLLELAKKKHIGMDNYWLAASFVKVEGFSTLPRMIKPITLGELRAFFLEKADWLMSRPA